MFPVQSVLRAAPSVYRNIVRAQLRGVTKDSNVVSVPGTVNILFAEKLAHGLLIGVGICFVPMWVLTHLRDYQGHD